jgi:hypothetical protein
MKHVERKSNWGAPGAVSALENNVEKILRFFFNVYFPSSSICGDVEYSVYLVRRFCVRLNTH